MPSGGYGLNEEDKEKIDAFLDDPQMKKFGMWYEWIWAYVSARGAGASPSDAALAAYTEWDI